MSDVPSELKVAMSYLEDVREKIEQIAQNDNPYMRASSAEKLIGGDLTLAHREIETAAAGGVDVSPITALCSLLEGVLAKTVYTGMMIGKEADKWEDRAIGCLEAAVEQHPTAEACYQLGVAYADDHRWEQSIHAFRQAEAANDPEFSLEARKAIGRVELKAKEDDPAERARTRKMVDKMEKTGPCFVATAVYGSPMASEVQVLRDYRDDTLLRRRSGRALAHLYDEVGPALAGFVADRPLAKAAVRTLILRPLILLIGCTSRYR